MQYQSIIMFPFISFIVFFSQSVSWLLCCTISFITHICPYHSISSTVLLNVSVVLLVFTLQYIAFFIFLWFSLYLFSCRSVDPSISICPIYISINIISFTVILSIYVTMFLCWTILFTPFIYIDPCIYISMYLMLCGGCFCVVLYP